MAVYKESFASSEIKSLSTDIDDLTEPQISLNKLIIVKNSTWILNNQELLLSEWNEDMTIKQYRHVNKYYTKKSSAVL